MLADPQREISAMTSQTVDVNDQKAQQQAFPHIEESPSGTHLILREDTFARCRRLVPLPSRTRLDWRQTGRVSPGSALTSRTLCGAVLLNIMLAWLLIQSLACPAGGSPSPPPALFCSPCFYSLSFDPSSCLCTSFSPPSTSLSPISSPAGHPPGFAPLPAPEHIAETPQ